MNAVGIDVSKDKSTVTIRRPSDVVPDTPGHGNAEHCLRNCRVPPPKSG